jgi:hypothetical protein
MVPASFDAVIVRRARSSGQRRHDGAEEAPPFAAAPHSGE